MVVSFEFGSKVQSSKFVPTKREKNILGCCEETVSQKKIVSFFFSRPTSFAYKVYSFYVSFNTFLSFPKQTLTKFALGFCENNSTTFFCTTF